MPQIIAYMGAGRTVEQKRAFMKKVSEATSETLGFALDSVIVQIVEAPTTDKSKGGVTFADNAAAKK